MPSMTRRGKGIAGLIILLYALCMVTVSAQESDNLRIAADPATQELLLEAENLLAAGQTRQAYNLLSPEETRLAGNPLFDYLYGVAALDTGRLSNAIFALQRALAVAPSFSGARLELARAYYDAGNASLARPLFERLLEEDPPAVVRAVVDRYLVAIDAAAPPTPLRRFVPNVDLTLGYDTNANGSTADQQFLGFTLAPQNVETSSSFGELGLGFDWLLPTSTQFGWQLGARVSHRANPDAEFVDSTFVSGVAGMNWQRGTFFGRAGIEGYWGARDGESNESYGGLDLLLGGRLNERWDLTFGFKAGAQRYDEAIEVLDVDRFLYNLGLTLKFPAALLTLQAIGGEESEVQDGSPYGNSKIGGRLSLNAQLGTSTLMFASLGSLVSDYDGLFFGAAREDTQNTAILQLEFRDVFTDGLSIMPRLRYIDNESDVELYEYDRTEIGVMFRWVGN